MAKGQRPIATVTIADRDDKSKRQDIVTVWPGKFSGAYGIKLNLEAFDEYRKNPDQYWINLYDNRDRVASQAGRDKDDFVEGVRRAFDNGSPF